MAAALADAADNAIAGKSFDPAPVLSWAGADVAITYRPLSAEQLTADRALAASDAPWNAAKWQARDRLLLAEEIGDRQSILCPVDVCGIGSTAIVAAPNFLRLLVLNSASAQAGRHACQRQHRLHSDLKPSGGGYEPTARGSRHTPDTGGIISRQPALS